MISEIKMTEHLACPDNGKNTVLINTRFFLVSCNRSITVLWHQTDKVFIVNTQTQYSLAASQMRQVCDQFL